ncbi:APOC4-APOC2 readthrough (NMD candidate) [Homo sapiens]|nr:APOC4-APOC2 readthrough (NMD candidate) [Homo sapiens]KAI4043308.1 APOC4-APOC2 readthrough (NMD candidate) [Homo sapiens]
MSLLRNRLQALPALCLCVLVLACIGACQPEAQEGTLSPPPKLKMSRWSLVRGRMKELLETVVNRTRDGWQWFWSLDTMGTRLLPALFLVLLVLGFEVQGTQQPQQDEMPSPTFLTQVKESLSSYWESAKTAAQNLYEKTYLPAVDEKLRDLYSKSTAAMSTYTGIFTDQVLSVLKGEE